MTKKTKPSKKKPKDTTALAGELDALNDWLEENEVEPRVVFGKPVTAAQVAQAEAALGAKLPPSYVDFVTTRGPLHLSGALTGRGRGNDTRLLTPADVVKETQCYRKEVRLLDDEESRAIVDDGLIFCVDPDGEYFHLFVISSADGRGEMPTRPWDYQDTGNNEPWHEGKDTFASVIESIIATVRKHALEED